MKALIVTTREILMAAKTVDGVYFSQLTGHVSHAVSEFELNEKPAISITGFAPNLDDPEEGIQSVWLHKHSFGWVLELDNGDKIALFN